MFKCLLAGGNNSNKEGLKTVSVNPYLRQEEEKTVQISTSKKITFRIRPIWAIFSLQARMLTHWKGSQDIQIQ
jgi:hypothetical protein